MFLPKDDAAVRGLAAPRVVGLAAPRGLVVLFGVLLLAWRLTDSVCFGVLSAVPKCALILLTAARIIFLWPATTHMSSRSPSSICKSASIVLKPSAINLSAYRFMP